MRKKGGVRWWAGWAILAATLALAVADVSWMGDRINAYRALHGDDPHASTYLSLPLSLKP
jgi:hypothetical protein